MSQGSVAGHCGQVSGVEEVRIKTTKHLHLIDHASHLNFITVKEILKNNSGLENGKF